MASLKELYPNYKEESELQPVYSNICTICGNDDTFSLTRDLGKTRKCNQCKCIFEANVTKFIKPVEITLPEFNFNNNNNNNNENNLKNNIKNNNFKSSNICESCGLTEDNHKNRMHIFKPSRLNNNIYLQKSIENYVLKN